MKLHTETNEVIRSGELVDTEFKIKATAKAFGILSSGLYSDKILAIVRELACNAYDAHIAAGKREVPIEIKLPTSLDPTFYVKDFGIGLDHAGVTELYTTYFESSKADSNDYIGALGLGSKSPFSYVQTFNVEARFNGTKRMYSAFINEKGVPAISKLGEEKTKDVNGLTVTLATRPSDNEKFKMAAMKALMYFDVQPKVIGGGSYFKPFGVKHTVEGNGWKLRESDYNAHMEGAYVVQGLVAYPIDPEILEQHGLSDTGHLVLEQNIDLFVKIGDVEVAASREALSYTKKTIQNLSRIVEEATKQMRAEIQKAMDKMPSLWDACLLHAQYTSYGNKMHHLYSVLSGDKPFTYKGKKVDDSFELDLKSIKETMMQVVNVSQYQRGNRGIKIRSGGSWQPTTATASKFSFSIHSGMKVLVDDANGGKAMLQAYFADDKNLLKSDDTYVLVIKGLSKNVYSASEVTKILDMLGATNAVYASNLTYTITKQKYNYRARKANEALQWDGYPENGGYRRNQIRRVYSRLCWASTKVDLQKDSGFYVPLERFAIMRNGHEHGSFDMFLFAMQEVGILPKGTKVIGLNEKQIFLVKKNANWKNVFDYAEQQFAAMNAKNELTDKLVADKIINLLGEGVRRSIVGNWSTIEPKLVDGSFKSIFDTVEQYMKTANAVKCSITAIDNAANTLGSGQKFHKIVADDFGAFSAKFSAAMNKHAMLGIVDWQKVSSKAVDMIIEYVNFVAKA